MSGSASLTLGLDNTNATFAGNITGGSTGGLTKLGSGTQTLSGTNTFTGPVLIRNSAGQTGGGLTISGGLALANSVAVRNAGAGTTFSVLSSETIGALTGTANSLVNLGTGATLTSSYTNGTATALATTADSASANGRIIKDINTAGLKPGDLISGTGISAPGYIVQIIDNNTVLVNRTPPTGPTNNFAPTVTSVGVLHSNMSGAGGFTKDGAGLLILTGNNTYTGATTINAGDVQIGGIWTGQKYSVHDVLSDSSQIVFAASGTQNLNFADSTNSLLSFERVGSIAGGAGTTTSINLAAGSNSGVLAIGGDNSTSTFTGRFMPTGGDSSWLIKEGTGNFTWSNPTSDVFNGPVFVENGTFTIAGAQGFDGSNEVYLTNRGTTLAVTTTSGDTIPFLQGGAGASRIILGTGTQPVGGTTSNYITSVAPVVTLTTNLTVNENTTPNLATLGGVFTFNGNFQGTGTLIKSGNHLWNLTGISSNAHTGETQITAGILRMGVMGAATGLGAPALNGQSGTLSTATGLRLTGGTLDINGTSQTVTRINASSTGGTIQLVNGALTLSNQNTQTTGTVITGNSNSVLNINSSAASTLTMTGNSNAFNGTYNVGTNAALTVNLAAGVLGDAARLNLNGTGTQLTVTLADTVGSIAGTGNAVLTQALSLREAGSGAYSAPAYSGATSGAGALILSGFGGLTVSGNLAHTGGTTLLSNAVLNLAYGAGNNILPTTGALTLNGGSLMIYSTAGSATVLESVASTTLNAGASSVSTAMNFAADDPTFQLGGLGGINLGAITRNVGGTLNVSGNAAATSNTNTNGILGGWATLGGGTWAVGDGAGTAAITGLSSYSADIFGAGLHVDITAAGTNAGGLADTLRFSGANASDINGATTIATGGILVTRSVGANTSTISGALDATGNELIIHQYNPLGDLVLSNVAGTNTIITTAGPGRTIITNDYVSTGGANIGYGYLQLGNGGAAGMVGTGNILNNGTLGINRNNAVTFGAAVISGTGNIEQLGSGTTTLGGANTFAGRVTVRGGTLEVTNNAGLGLGATAATNRWANFTSVKTGGTLSFTGGVTSIAEVLNLAGGTMNIGTTAASTYSAPLILLSDSTINVADGATALNHLITGQIIAAPGADLTVGRTVGTAPATLVLAPASAATAGRWENTTINTNGRLQVGNNSAGFLGTGSVTNNGELITNTNNGHLVLGNSISGSGNFTQARNTVYLTADNTYTGTTTVGLQSVNAAASLRIGNDTYTGMHGTGDITVQAVTAGNSDFRYHLLADNTIANNFILNANSDGTTARNATVLRQGIGNITLTGNLTIGATNLPAPGTQRAILQTEGGGILSFDGTIVGGSSTNLLNLVNNGIFRLGGSASNSYHGVLSGNNVWVFANTGTTTLLGVNTVNSANSYLQKGTLVLGTGGANTWEDSGDMHVLNGATLSIAGNETFDVLYTQRGATVNIASGATLTLDGGASQLLAGAFAGAGSLTLAGGNYMALYGTNTATGILQLGSTTTNGQIQTANLTNAIGSFSSIILGGTTGVGTIDYVGSGETFANNITLAGTGSNWIAANGNGALILSGNLTATGATSTLRLIGQTGGYFNPIKNRIDGVISDGANALSIAMTNTGDDDRFGITGRWALTNPNNDFSGAITVNVGMLEFMGDLKTGVETASVAGDLSVARTFTLGSNNFNGRRYDMFGSGDQLSDAGYSQGTNTLTPAGDVGTIIFNDPNVGVADLTNITWAMPNVSTTNTSGMQFINDGTKQINLYNAFTFGTTGNRVVALDGSNTLSNTIFGAIGNPTTSQSTRVDKEGPGTWRLAGANTYTGATTVLNGILELAGGAAINDSATVAISAAGADGRYSGTAQLRIVNSETIGSLSGNVGGSVVIDAGQTLTIGDASNQSFTGTIGGAGGLTRTLTGGTARTQTLTNKNSYTGITTLGATGAATASPTLTVYHLANGGSDSSIGASTSAATNLVFTSNAANNQGGILNWAGFTNQSTDRLFTIGLGTNAARINASGSVVGTTVPTLTFSNTAAVAFTGSGTRTLTVGGTGLGDNVFRPQITDSGGATTLSKVDGGIWVINPDVAGNTYTGGTSITGGTLAIQAANALGSGTITINGGGGTGLEIRGAGMTLANAITNSSADGGIRIVSGANTFSGLLTNSAQLRFNVESGASVNLTNATSSLTGAGTLLKFGDGTLTLSGTNGSGWTGATAVRDGVLALDFATNNTSKLADGAALTLGGISALTTLGADANVGGQSRIVGNGGGAVTLIGGSHTEVVSATTIDIGSNAITRTSGSGILRLNAITRNVGGTIDFGAASIAQTDTNNTNGILGVGYATIGKANWAQSVATGAADTSITALASYNVDSYGATNNVDVTTSPLGSAANTLRFNTAAGGTFNHVGTLAMTGGGLLVTPAVASGDVIVQGGTIANAANTSGLEALIIHQHSARALQINSIIANNTNAQGLTKSGNGKLFLNAVNTYTGALNLNEGEIQVGGTAAAPTAATNATLGGGNAINMGAGSTLRFRTSNTSVYNTGAITGDGQIILDAGNVGVVLFDDNNDNFYGDITLSGGTIQVGLQNNALGNARGVFNISNNVNFVFNDARTINKLTNYAQGTVLNITSPAGGAFSGAQNFNNTTAAGLNFNIAAPTTAGAVGLNLSGVIYGSNGFTKTGPGILQISAVNFADVYDGYTSANRTPTFSGQISVNNGILYVGNARALGAHGVGNETIVASGASIDLRGQALNYDNDSDTNREIIKIQGTGFNGSGALRNSSGTGQISFLTLDGNATVNTGGTEDASAMVIGTFDSNLANGNTLTGAYTRNRPVISGNNNTLTIQGGRISSDNLIISDPSFSSALNQVLVREGSLRFRHEVGGDVLAASAITGANITNGIEIGYAGTTAADLNGVVSGTGANVGSRLQFDNHFGTHHTVNISMNGTLAATATGTPGGARSMAGGANYLAMDFFTIPDATTYLDGTLTLSGAANRNIIVSDSLGNYSIVEQGNTRVAPVTKMIIGGVVDGTGGFTKIGFAETRLTASNTLSGDVNVLRFGTSSAPWQSSTVRINGVDYATNGLGEGWAEWGLTLNGPNGALSNVANITLQRRGMITLDNTNRLDATSGAVGANHNNRINDTAVFNFENGWLRLNAGSVANTETLGTVNINSGTNILDLYGTDGANVNNVLTITTLNRAAGGVLRIQNLDATSTFGSAAGAADSVQMAVGTLNATQVGGGGLVNTTNRNIALGILGGTIPLGLDTDLRILAFNNEGRSDLWNQQRNLQFLAGSHFMTYEGGFLRPLDDDEYYVPTNGLLSSAMPAAQNVNLNDAITIMKDGTTINALRFGPLADNDGSGGTLHSGTTLTGLSDHYALNLLLDGTLKISSGMISSAYFAVGNTSNLATYIYGGALDFDGREAIINNQNGGYFTINGTVGTGNFEIRTAITNAIGLTKTGLAQVILDGVNTYTGLTTINDGTLFLRNGRSALGMGGAGNGVVITGNGHLNSGNGIVVGTAAAREDIYVGILQGDQYVARNDNDVTVWNSNLTIDNVDLAGHPLFTPRVRTDNSAVSIFNGNIAGGATAVLNDVVQIDSRRLSFDSTGNNLMIFNGLFGDRFDGSGNAIPVADPVSALPTVAGTRTNENEVLRVNLGAGSLETNYVFNRQYNAAGRLEIEQGIMIVNYDPAAMGNDGSGFWTNTAISKIPNADSITTSFAVNGGSSGHMGFVLNDATGGTVNNNGSGALFLSRAGQWFNMASWTMGGTGAKYIGGLNETGTVTYGTGNGTLSIAGNFATLYAADGGTVVFNQRLTGNVGTAPANWGFLKQGRGTVELWNSTAGAGDSNFILMGGTLVLNHTAATSVALVGNQNARFDGGTIISVASSGANTTEGFANNDAADRVLNFNLGGNEIVARTTNTGTARNMTVAMGNGNSNATTSNFTRAAGTTANLVEDNSAGGTAAITLNFNASSTAAAKDALIPWMTYGVLSRSALDFARVNSTGNAVDSFTALRAAGDFNNNVATWTASGNISENGGTGFSGTLGGGLTINSLRFDANADSVVDLGSSVLTIAAPALAQSASGLLVSSNVGSANKTISGTGGLTATGGRSELILHHYGTGNLNVNVPITGAIGVVISGPSTTSSSTFGSSGTVVFNGANTYTGKTYVNGAALSISSVSQLGANPGSSTADQITLNGGTLRYTGSGLENLGNRGILFNPNGGVIDVVDGAGELYVSDTISNAAQFRGDLIKLGAGTLTLEGATGTNTYGNPGFLGLIDVRQGTLRVTAPNLASTATSTLTQLGSSLSYADGTIFRFGTNFAIQPGNNRDADDWNMDEWLTFEGNNYVSVGTINTDTGNISGSGFPDPGFGRPINLNGLITINGTTTFDVVPGQTLRLNNGGTLMTTGSGTMIKDGQGTMVLSTNNAGYTGNIVVKQGTLYGIGQADPFGTGHLTGATITLGSDSRQGLAVVALGSDNVQGQIMEINHDINVVYNPAQTKRVLFETFANGSQINWNGDVIMNDNLQVYINDAAENGGSQNYVNFNGQLFDGATTSGNLVLTGDDTGSANDNTSGRPYNYLVLKNNNSGWTGDVRVNTNTSYDQDQTAILRLEHAQALTAANDVDMGYNSMLQVGGGARTIGSLSTNGGTGPFLGGVAGGTMGASSNGTSVVIENAAATAGTLTITQSTPASTEVQWNAHFRDGTLNSQFLAPGSGPTASAALNIVKAGSGWATITTDNNYTGTTTVTGGILQVGRLGVGDTGAAGAAGLTSSVGTTIAGSGVIQGNSTINGLLKPGDEAGGSMGTLTVNGNLTLGSGSTTTMQVQRASYTAYNHIGYDDPGYGTWLGNIISDPTYSHLMNDPVTYGQHDKLLVTGNLTADGKIILANNGYTPNAGDIFNLIDWLGSITGTWDVGGTSYNGGLLRTGAETGTDLDLFELGGSYRWDVSQFNSFGYVVVVVPEPSRVLLLMFGLLAFFFRRRRD